MGWQYDGSSAEVVSGEQKDAGNGVLRHRKTHIIKKHKEKLTGDKFGQESLYHRGDGTIW